MFQLHENSKITPLLATSAGSSERLSKRGTRGIQRAIGQAAISHRIVRARRGPFCERESLSGVQAGTWIMHDGSWKAENEPR
jgi:hypothetical protein